MSPRIWLNDNNKFVPAYHRDINITGIMASPTPAKIDSKVKIIGISNANIGSTVQVHIAE
jgi:hypothetical protein